MPTYQQLIQQGDHFFEQQRLAEAIQAFGLAAQMQPEQKEPLTKLGLICKDMGDLDGAADFFRKVAAQDANDAFVRLQLGLVRYEQGSLAEAEPVLQNAAELIDRGTAAMRADLEAAAPQQEGTIRQQCEELEETADAVRLLIDEIRTEQAAAEPAV